MVVSNQLFADECIQCHKNINLNGSHSNITCETCHKETKIHFARSADFNGNSTTCVDCHQDYKGITHSIMVSRKNEKEIINRIFAYTDNHFFDNNCNGCHVRSCMDCHLGSKGNHEIVLPGDDQCLTCHHGYFTGIDYVGLAIREDHERYKRGITYKGGHYLKMLPDIHHEKGMMCRDCHSMESLSKGQKSSKKCIDCHKDIDKNIIEHSIDAHLERLECYSCHSAWAVQEYGTFYVQLRNSDVKKYYKWIKQVGSDYVKGNYVKEYNQPPIGLNKKGKYTPIRPEFIFFHTKIINNQIMGMENNFLGSYWKAFFPHTVRRETVLCGNCHDNDRRFVMLDRKNDIYDLKKDGIPLESFWNTKEQKVYNGGFIDHKTYKEKIKIKNKGYLTKYLEKWQKIVKLLTLKEEE